MTNVIRRAEGSRLPRDDAVAQRHPAYAYRDGLSRLHADVYRERREQEVHDALDVRGLAATCHVVATALMNLEEARNL
jgi:hypothetical protein